MQVFEQGFAFEDPKPRVDVRYLVSRKVAREFTDEPLGGPSDERDLHPFPSARAHYHVAVLEHPSEFGDPFVGVRAVRVGYDYHVKASGTDACLERRPVPAVLLVVDDPQLFAFVFRELGRRAVGGAVVDYYQLVVAARLVHRVANTRDGIIDGVFLIVGRDHNRKRRRFCLNHLFTLRKNLR